MAKTLQERVRLAIADPGRIRPFFYHRSRNLLRRMVGLRAPQPLDPRLIRSLEHKADGSAGPLRDEAERLERARQLRATVEPLMRDARTYNPFHPDYRPKLVRNYPGRVFNRQAACDNRVFAALCGMMRWQGVPDGRWDRVLADALAEVRSIPEAEQMFERRRFVEAYIAELRRAHAADYQPGWVNLEDALFLYWLVRQAKPRTIVQTGVCNGLSSAFMVLALVKNGQGGRLRAVDLPMIFDPDDPDWTVPGTSYGVIIPQRETSGWLVPDAYRDLIDVWSGDAKELLPKLVDEVEAIDLFFHDSDHTYDHMMFEFREVKRKLGKGGLIVADDVTWNASLWDFADLYGVPAYNYKSSVGVAFF